MNEHKQALVEFLLEQRMGSYAVRVYHDDDPAEIRGDLRDQGRLQGDDDELAELMWNWVAEESGADHLI